MTIDKETIDIIVNMEKRAIGLDILSPDQEISFDQVVALATEEGRLPTGPYIEYEVLYENAIARPQDGVLRQGKSVKVQDGTIFNVTFTDKS